MIVSVTIAKSCPPALLQKLKDCLLTQTTVTSGTLETENDRICNVTKRRKTIAAKLSDDKVKADISELKKMILDLKTASEKKDQAEKSEPAPIFTPIKYDHTLAKKAMGFAVMVFRKEQNAATSIVKRLFIDKTFSTADLSKLRNCVRNHRENLIKSLLEAETLEEPDEIELSRVTIFVRLTF
jgi:hypothetical protein